MPKLDIPKAVFHRVEDPRHPGEYLYPGVCYTEKSDGEKSYYIRYRDKQRKPRFER